MTTCAEWTDKLAAAQGAFELLVTGGKVASIRVGEKEVKYTQANVKDLTGYIKFLQGKVDTCNGRRGGGIVHFTPSDC